MPAALASVASVNFHMTRLDSDSAMPNHSKCDVRTMQQLVLANYLPVNVPSWLNSYRGEKEETQEVQRNQRGKGGVASSAVDV